MKLFIKNMVCGRCKLVIENELKVQGLSAKTVSLGEVDFGDNQREIEMAKNISEVTCSKHVIIQLKEFSLEDLDGILSAMSDPVSDLSAIPTYLICN